MSVKRSKTNIAETSEFVEQSAIKEAEVAAGESDGTSQFLSVDDNRLAAMADRAEGLIQSLKKRAEDMLQWQEEIKEEKRKTEELSRQVGEQSKKLLETESLRKLVQSREEVLNKREEELGKRTSELDKTYRNRFAELEKKYTTWEQERTEEKQKLEQRQLLLTKREAAIAEQENALAITLAQREADSERELLESKQQNVDTFLAWASARAADWDEKLKGMLSDHEQNLSKMREDARNEVQRILVAERESALKAIEEELEQKKQELKDIQAARLQIEKDQDEIKVQKKRIEQRNANLDKIIADTQSAEMEAIKRELILTQQTNEELLARLQEKSEQFSEYEQIRAEWGENPPAKMEGVIRSLKRENKEITEELMNRPNNFDLAQLKELQNKNQILSATLDQIRREKFQLESSYAEMENAQNKLIRLEQKVEILQASNEDLVQDNTILRNEIKRLRSDDGCAAERDERIKSIEKHIDTVVSPKILDGDEPEPRDEMEWLQQIGECCLEYGFKFPTRILYAFHTALKISDWSTITVLAGVSGTGKSELPHLYARFGGLNFISVPVQPNWDSQESMLGFFNSIDNKFDAQPLLRFLAQCSSMQNNMDRSLNIVLLDEMNLAHVEHYFAEFLSKLELRRDYGDEEIPNIDINIGAGMEPYELALTRNILWTGTMNQDETTKSLSDKVLDRGIVIHFPRPKTLIGRHEKKNLDEFVKKKKIPMLDYRIWRNQWLHEPNFQGDQRKEMLEYKVVIEEINNRLAKAGRALGHRVWQSVEYYLANYPIVVQQRNNCEEGELPNELKEAMRTAFEDQLVQKVMPKLRGIETTGAPRQECLDPIQHLLEEKDFKLGDDFRQACSYGYGQFIWNSADYIDDNDMLVKTDAKKSDADEDDEG